MTMAEVEKDILTDLEELGDPISRYSFFIECAKECKTLPEEYRTDDYKIKECQVNTWAVLCKDNDRCHFYADSEALLVKGALTLLQEIYENRTEEETSSYKCGLLNEEAFISVFTPKQRKGLEEILFLF
ncbi:MAG: SufE family protein [Parasporobacterium sp.]|nr:SufE family protein [Parasporobacterium sp.]